MKKNAAAIRKVFQTVSLGAPEKAVGFVMWRVVHRYMREVDHALISLDLTHLQFMTLALTAWLGKTGDAVTQSDVAKHAEMHPMQVSLMLKALEKKNLILRTRNDADVRAKSLALTSEGVAILRRALPLVVEVQKDVFGGLAQVEGDFLKTLLRLEAASGSEQV